MLVGKSDQLDNADLLAGPRDFTITAVIKRPGDQPLEITLAEYDRPWRPGLTMRRLLAHIWGKEGDVFVGRRVRLYRDPDVSFGKDKTGGTRLSHASHIERRVTVSLPTSKGKFGAFTVEPLTEVAAPAPTEPTVEQVAASTDSDALRAMWQASGVERRAQIEARVDELNAQAEAVES